MGCTKQWLLLHYVLFTLIVGFVIVLLVKYDDYRSSTFSCQNNSCFIYFVV